MILTIKQAAAQIGCTERAIYGAIKSGRLPTVKVGKKTCIRSADLDTYYRENLGRNFGVTPRQIAEATGLSLQETAVALKQAKIEPIGSDRRYRGVPVKVYPQWAILVLRKAGNDE